MAPSEHQETSGAPGLAFEAANAGRDPASDDAAEGLLEAATPRAVSHAGAPIDPGGQRGTGSGERTEGRPLWKVWDDADALC